jgi:uncharacterized Zn finger protein (UPF0148 family)
MGRKTRYWFCRKCGAVYRRKKADVFHPCYECGAQDTHKATKWPKKAAEIRARYDRKTTRRRDERSRLIKRHIKIRGAYGYVLKPAPETKAAWREFLKAKQRRTFESRGQAFLEEIAEDLWSCPHHRGRITGAQKRECKCPGGGIVGAPKLSIEPKFGGDAWTLGQYRRQIMQGIYDIRIGWKSETRPNTMLHEVVHWADDLAGIMRNRDYGGHSNAFYSRLEDLAKRLRFELIEGEVD